MQKSFLLFIFLCFSLCSFAQAKIDKVEPPFWWTGMQNNTLQLLIHGENIGSLELSCEVSGVKITKVHRPDNKNYLFVDLEIASGATAQIYPIVFKDGRKKVHTINYELKQRASDSANRKGSDGSDAIYLITPDRFANGNPNNDVIAGMKEGHDRSLEYGRHGGDIQGISEHLEYINSVGFTSIWLNPVLENDMNAWSYHGYATTDYYNVDRRFGSNEEYAELGLKGKKLGMGMIMDIIVNHCGSEHYWMEDPPFPDWFNNQGKEYMGTNHRKFTLLDPYSSKIDREIMTNGWFVETMPDLNQRNPYMSTYLIQNSIWWIEYAHITGIRQDTYSYPFKEFMTDWSCAIRNEYPNFYIVGEEWVENPAIISYWQEGKNNADGNNSCLPGLMDFPLCFALHNALRDEESWGSGLVELYETVAMDFLYPDPSQLVIFPDNHDMSRIYSQLNENDDHYKMALSYIATMRGIPQLYYGTEILMANRGTDSHGIIRSDFPGGWAGDEVSAKDAKGLKENEKEALDFCTKLLNWRKEKQVIHNGDLTHFHPADNMYVYFRHDSNEKVMVIMNKNKENVTLNLDRFQEMLKGISNGQDVISKEQFNMQDEIILKPMRTLILELN